MSLAASYLKKPSLVQTIPGMINGGMDKVFNMNHLQRVLLSPISDDLQNDENLEPQMVRIRTPNSALLYLDLAAAVYQGNSSYVIGSKGEIFINNFKRMCVKAFLVEIQIPNINQRNNVFTFTTTGLDSWTATIGEGFYTPASFGVLALVAALNAAGSPVTFTSANIPNSLLWQLNGSGTFSFTGGSGITNGKYLFGIPINTPLATSMTIGAVYLYYSRYMDITSIALMQFSKFDSAGPHVDSNLILRIYLDPLEDTVAAPNFVPLINPLQWINFNPTNTLQNVDLMLVDEFNQPFYIPTYLNNFAITMVLLLER